jgi:hypothetical protein
MDKVEQFYQAHVADCFVEPYEQTDDAVDEIFDRFIDIAESESLELSDAEQQALYEKVYAGVF